MLAKKKRERKASTVPSPKTNSKQASQEREMSSPPCKRRRSSLNDLLATSPRVMVCIEPSPTKKNFLSVNGAREKAFSWVEALGLEKAFSWEEVGALFAAQQMRKNRSSYPAEQNAAHSFDVNDLIELQCHGTATAQPQHADRTCWLTDATADKRDDLEIEGHGMRSIEGHDMRSIDSA